MKITIASIGKTKPTDPENIIENRYIERTNFNITKKELELKKVNKDIETRKLEESKLILEATQGTYLIALDDKGKEFSSKEFADFLNKLQSSSTSQISFAIGGASGHHKTLLDKVNTILSLGKMTLPHKLARAILVEQLYRAETILNNHPYNK